MICRAVPIFFLSLAAMPPAHAGSVLEFATTEYGGATPIEGTVQMSTEGDNTRLEIISVTSGEAGGLIYQGAAGRMIILDHVNGQYFIMDQEQIDALAGQVGAAMAQMQQALEDMPPEERALAEQMMQADFGTPADAPSPDVINELGSHGTIAGIQCRNYEVVRNGRKLRELCISDWDDLEGGQETARALRGVAGFFEKMRQAFAGTGGMAVFDRQQELFGHMSEVDGYPILSRDFRATGGLALESQLTAVRTRELGADFFEPPNGYTLQQMPEGMN